ncbi:acyltransferase domain-containing protein [Streptomyces sp. FIT100]|uniref:acyltransferase domain-containing protein n=1 Tax=Streptomyces sp. FIT100 TaxID=2837956 RepID=UPI0021C9499B|nr:acyltransferase domain-containing protein [Streptomyces sp. FIT100]UUN30934.1 acyltransferase domain-containing protein [Streptomyces sp. FIT100]
MNTSTAVLFPGQGAYRPGALHAVHASFPAAAAVLEEVSAAADGKLDRLLGEGPGPALDELVDLEPGLLQLAIFATSVGLWAAHQESLPDGAVLMGHSLGEIAALTCAGGFSVTDGTRIVLARNRALESLEGRRGGMAAIGLDAERAAALLRLADEPSLTVACVNTPDQSVVAGAAAALAHLAGLAEKLGVPYTRLKSPFAFHSPLMARAVQSYRENIVGIRQRPLLRKVYSPLLGRHVMDSDDLLTVLTRQFLEPVQLLSAVQDLFARGARTFLECGAGEATVGLVRRSVAGVQTHGWDIPAPAGKLASTTEAPAVAEATGAASAVHAPREPAAAKGPVSVTAVQESVEEITATLRVLYAEVLGYPPEVFEEGADLEAELGIDSLKQTQLLVQVADRFRLAQAQDMRTVNFPTLEKIAEEVRRRQAGREDA